MADAMFPFMDPGQSLDARVSDLLARLTLEEKVSQLTDDSRAVPRLGVPAYDWWNECLHGVGRAGTATVFPQAIGLAATFDTDLLHAVGAATSDEARAKHHEFARQGYRRQYHGLSFFSPNVNIFRDPRWGRGQETFGEDPYLAGRLGVAFIRGLQGDHPFFYKTTATAKHYAVHSGPEALRHTFDATVSAQDLRETYLPAFRDCVVEGRVASVMGAYNRTNGEPCCASPTLLGDILRREWGFEGFVVSDCGAVEDFHRFHTVTSTVQQSTALAVREGCDLECGWTYPALTQAVREGLVTQQEIDRALGRVLRARFRLGLFDPPARVPGASLPYETLDSPEHKALALRAARESVVLLRNEGPVLPLRAGLTSVAVIGPFGDNRDVLLGNYNGFASSPVTVLDGIRAIPGKGTRILFSRGCGLSRGDEPAWGERPDNLFPEALAAAERADAVVLCLGLGNAFEGEQGDSALSDWQGDRLHLGLPKTQARLVDAVSAKLAGTGKPLVLVLLTGSPVTLPWAPAALPAVLQAWYPGQEGGAAVAEILFGKVNPSGRLPVTFVESERHLPPFTEYAMEGRTYRFCRKDPQFPFGFGLSYTTFEYTALAVASTRVTAGQDVTVTVTVRNAGRVAGDEVVQVYLQDVEASSRVPRWKLAGFTRVTLGPRRSATVALVIPSRSMAQVTEDGRFVVEPGLFRVHAGGHQPDARSAALAHTGTMSAEFTVTGEALVLPG